MSIPTINVGINDFEPQPSGRTMELDDLLSFIGFQVTRDVSNSDRGTSFKVQDSYGFEVES